MEGVFRFKSWFLNAPGLIHGGAYYRTFTVYNKETDYMYSYLPICVIQIFVSRPGALTSAYKLDCVRHSDFFLQLRGLSGMGDLGLSILLLCRLLTVVISFPCSCS